jgi:hypothetical protein
MENRKTENVRLPNQIYLPRPSFPALLQEANHCGWLSEIEVQFIQAQIMDLLKNLIKQYTSMASSSIRTETAQNLLLSILYCIDAYNRDSNDPYGSIREIKSRGLKDIYQQGLELVRKSLQETEKLYARVKAEKLVTPLIAYNNSIAGISAFFSSYDVRFGAHQAACDIDYPLLFDDTSITGVFYIEQYLKKLGWENDFCRLFAAEDIDWLMENYGRAYHIPYQDYLLNISEIVLTNAVFTVMLGNPVRKLNLSPFEYSLLQNKLKGLATDALPAAVSQAMRTAMAELDVESALANYFQPYAAELSARLKHALKQGTLSKLVITSSVQEHTGEISFDPGKKMDNKRFRGLVKRLLDCNEPSAKISLIMSNIASLIDFIDILKADCLFEQEYLLLFQQLGDVELAILTRMALGDELRNTDSLDKALAGKLEPDVEWKGQFVAYLKSIPCDRLNKVENLIQPGGYM